jgi:guanylate kinase
MYKIVTISGKAGAGKDTILQSLLKVLREDSRYPQVHEIVSCTTRPPREGEVDGKNYYFLTHEEFVEKVSNDRMLEATIFNGWCYGTCIDYLREDLINIGVYNPAGVDALMDDYEVEVFSILVEASDKVRLLRQLSRENNPNVKEIIRRYSADEEDFDDYTLKDIGFKYIVNNDEGSDLQEIARELAYIILNIDWPEESLDQKS